MAEQLSMFSASSPVDPIEPELPTSNIPLEPEYEALDYQLADLMVELNDFVPEDEKDKKKLNKTLRHCTLEISKRTREGQISNEVTAEQQALLLQTTVVGEAGDYMPLVIDTGHSYLNRYWQYQQRLADQINARIEAKENLTQKQHAWVDKRLDDYFPSESNSAETNWQKQAVELALQNRFLIVSGGPGTGKTTTITRLLALLIEQHLQSFTEIDQENNAQPSAS